MAKKIKKFSGEASPRRTGEKFRRAGVAFNRIVMVYIFLVLAAVLAGSAGDYDLSKVSTNGFAICFLLLPAYLPLLIIDGIAMCFGSTIFTDAGHEVFILGVCDIFIALNVWWIVRFAAMRRQSVNILRTAKVFVLIMVCWGVLQLLFSLIQFSREKSSFSDRHSKNESAMSEGVIAGHK